MHGFVSKPEIQKLNRNSIFIFVNGRLIRDRLVQHALTEAYRNIMPPTVYPVVLLFLELPAAEVDVNVHPSKTEVRFRQQSVDARFRARLGAGGADEGAPGAAVRGRDPRARHGRPGAHAGTRHFEAHCRASASDIPAMPGLRTTLRSFRQFALQTAGRRRFPRAFSSKAASRSRPMRDSGGARLDLPVESEFRGDASARSSTLSPITDALRRSTSSEEEPTLSSLGTLKPLGQIRNSFILAVNEEGLWIVDQHVAHERVLFERVLKQRAAQKVESQRLLMPIVLELSPAQQAVFAEISDELAHNGFEAEPFGARSVAVKVAPAGVEPRRSSTCCTNCSISSRAKSSR